MAGLFESQGRRKKATMKQESADHLFGEKLGGIPVVIWVALGVVAVWIYESRKSSTAAATTATAATPGTTGSLTPAEYAQAYYAENPTAYLTTPVYITSGVGGGSSGTGVTTGGTTPGGLPVGLGTGTTGKKKAPSTGPHATTTPPKPGQTAATAPRTSPFVSGRGVSLEETGKLTTGTVTTKTGALATTIPTYTQTVAAIRAGTRVGYVTAATGTIVPITSVADLEKLEGSTSASKPGKGKQTTTYVY